jgi:hypothetical protein
MNRLRVHLLVHTRHRVCAYVYGGVYANDVSYATYVFLISGTHFFLPFYINGLFFIELYVEMEAQWMKNISNETICNYFYFFYIVYAVLAVITVIGMIGILTMMRLPKVLMVTTGFQGLIALALAATTALFHYLICDRALLAQVAPKRAGVRGESTLNPDMIS